jgi:ribose 5-phosphate isomerase A
VAREMAKRGAAVVYRSGVFTDNGNVILDVFNINLDDPLKTETDLNNIPGIICHGLFARRNANILLLAESTGVKEVRV